MAKANSKQLIAACKLWDKITTKSSEGKYKIPDIIDRYGGIKFYHDSDYSSLSCKIDGDKAEVTVGGSAGHKAHVNLEEKVLVYYDPRTENNKTVWRLFKAVKIQCARDQSGVHCKGLSTPAKIKNAFKVLSMPASMDFRRSHCQGKDKSLEECMAAELKYFRNGPKKEGAPKKKSVTKKKAPKKKAKKKKGKK